MQQYIETLFRRKALFLIPATLVPLLTILMTFVTGRQYEVRASVWVQPTVILEGVSLGRGTPNEAEAQKLNDRLKTVAFAAQIIERSGLKADIEAGRWPRSSPLQAQLAGVPVLGLVARVVGAAPPRSTNEAMVMAIRMIRGSLKATTVGENLVVVTYAGTQPQLGQRLIEETLKLHQEETRAARQREAEAGLEGLSQELTEQQRKLNGSSERLARFEERFPPPPAGLQRPVDELRELQRLQQEQQLDQARYETILNMLEELRLRSEALISTSDLQFRVVDPPEAGSSEATISARRLGLMGIMGITMGFMLGTVLIVLVTWRDTRVRTRSNVEKAVSVPMIIEVPAVRSSAKARSRLLQAAIGLAPTGQADRS